MRFPLRELIIVVNEQTLKISSLFVLLAFKPKVFGKLSALASNDVNFAKRPLAGIYAKLTMLRDNFVVAMV